MYASGLVPFIVVSGGSRAVPDGSEFPTEAERRTMATARRRWPGKQVAVTSEQVSFDDYCTGSIPVDRILSMLAGEALRLESYTATGLIDLGEPVPTDILSAAHALQRAGFNSRSLN
ncbi:MAG TPA: hypothetical protein VF482_10305 [Trebonia sp.]